MDDLARRLLRYVGHDRAMQRLRDLVRYGHAMTPAERARAERALCSTPTRPGWPLCADARGEQKTAMKIGSDTLLEADNYDAELIDYTDTKQDGTPLMSNPYQGVGEPKPQWRFAFELLDPEFAGKQLSAWVTKPADEDNIHPKAKLVEVVGALLPGLKPGQDWKMADLLHQRCRLQVEVYQKTDGTRGNKIGGFLAPKGATGEAAPQARQAVAAGAREAVPTVAQRKAAAAQATLDAEEIPF